MLAPHIEKAQRKANRRHQLTMQGILVGIDEQTLTEIMRDRAIRHRERMLGRRQNAMEQRLQTLSTRELLSMFNDLRSFDDDDWTRTDDELVEWWAIKKVLDTRPHVIRKREGHHKRSWEATRRHGQGKNRNRGETKKQKLAGLGTLISSERTTRRPYLLVRP